MKEKIYASLSAEERGDYQTPLYFVEKVCDYLIEKRNINPNVIIEPTFGVGNFIEKSILKFKDVHSFYGVEISKDYFDQAKEKFNKYNKFIKLYNENIFNFKFEEIKNNINVKEKVLIIGNPPWITNTELGICDSENIPKKENIKKLKGLDALTGKSNFDIAEYIILKLIENFQEYDCTVVMLCKNIVIKNLLRDLIKTDLNINNIEMVPFEAKSIFGVSCDASILIFDISNIRSDICRVYDIDSKELLKSFGWYNGVFISDFNEYKKFLNIDGKCKFEWRQGIKHDCSKIMQLRKNDNYYINGNKEIVYLEEDYVFPLLKSSDIKDTIINNARFNVIVTQKIVKEDTDKIEFEAPLLWKYLNNNSMYLDKRKSSIYKNSPRFSIFGVGEYSFKPYKVCISGFYKEPKFSLAFKVDKKPIMLDDTCYFIGFDKYEDALITTVLLNTDIVNKFLKSIAFLEAKRPYTKEILMRIDLEKLYNNIDYQEFISIMNSLGIKEVITKEDYKNYYDIIVKE